MALATRRSEQATLSRLKDVPTGFIGLFALTILLISMGYMVRFGTHYQLDLQVYRAAEKSLIHGGAPYSALFTRYQLPFTYPPFALLVLSPVSFGTMGLTESVWWLANVVSLVMSLYLLVEAERSRGSRFTEPEAERCARRRSLAIAAALAGLSTLALEPVRSNIDYGQINLILMLMITRDLTLRSSRWQGLLVGVAAAIKLTPLVFLLFFVVRGDRRSLLRAISAFVIVTSTSWLILPQESSAYWFHLVFDVQRIGQLNSVRNQSLDGLLHRLLFNSGYLSTSLWATLCIVVLVCAMSVLLTLFVSGRIAESVLVLALAEVLVSPVSWTHHWSWLAIAPIVVVALWESHRVVAWMVMVVLVVGMIAPYAWLSNGPLSYVANNALVIIGATTLGAWAVAEGFSLPKWARLERYLLRHSRVERQGIRR